ncbi:hypothetical protein [Xenorhabdus szentirmaii]|uniref:hypothetical protein n=1 Tax=Xenorhabdus szentirmaii TaxID=290112 RepID=UPI0019CE131B|nr:hypothetical protein [Xenorhabdus sp. 38]MBD2780195.1 hypothetical protein [Xenorhabdus sp. 38]
MKTLIKSKNNRDKNMFSFCYKHEIPYTSHVSKQVAQWVSNGEEIKGNIRYIYIESTEERRKIVVDNVMFEKYFPGIKENSVTIKDRNKPLREMNDRLLVRKITQELSSVCRQCLAELLDDEELSMVHLNIK